MKILEMIVGKREIQGVRTTTISLNNGPNNGIDTLKMKCHRVKKLIKTFE